MSVQSYRRRTPRDLPQPEPSAPLAGIAVSVLSAAGAILLQNSEARALYAVARNLSADETNAFVAHAVNRREAAAIWQQVAGGGQFSGDLLVHTSAGIRRHRVELTRAGEPSAAETSVVMTEQPMDVAVAATLAAEAEGQRFRDFAQVASDWVWELDEELRFTYMSDNMHAPSAPLAEAFLGKRITEVRLGDIDKIDWSPLLAEQMARRPFRDVRFERRLGNGTIRHISISGVPMFDDEGNFRGYRGIGRDITQQVNAEARAAAAQARLIDAIESIPACLVLLDSEDRILLCNSRYREAHAAIEDKLTPGTPFADLCRASAEAGLIPAAAGRIDAWLAERMARHRSFGSWTEERQAKGRWFQLTERPTAEGGTVLVQVDVTDLKRREQELAEKTQVLQATFDNMEQGLLVLDRDLRIKAWNGRFLQLLGVPPESVQFGASVADVTRLIAERGEYGPGDIDEIITRRNHGLIQLDPPVRERRRPDGTMLEQRRVRMPDGGLLVTYTDVTERKRVEGDLRRARDEAELASRSKTEFLANMSHELRTPLNAVIGFSDVLIGEIFGPLGDARYRDYAHDIRDSGNHLLNLINDVLDVAKIEFGRIELSEEEVPLGEVIGSCVRLMRERADAAGVGLTAEVPADLPTLRADVRRMKQVLLNLLSNAVKFTPSGGEVTVAASVDEGGLVLSVKDTGIGMAAEDLAIALQPFGQIDSRLARKYQGTGLGLPLTKAMVELHGGRLELISASGQGTTARVHLPADRVLKPASRRAG
ncbi:MAG TPA: PAS-domain containing protein [Stellaceae bacterium]|nr:PAS-domain containing protein [Stellaceae bacterium]